MKILLTGATGYLGGRLCQALTGIGYDVIAVHLNHNERLDVPVEESHVQRVYLSDERIKEIVARGKPDGIIHTATLYGRTGESVPDMINANVIFPVEMMISAIENGVKFFINTDSILNKFVSTYSMTKGTFADWLAFYADKIKAIDIKLDHFYGPNDKGSKFIVNIVDQLKSGVASIDLTEGSQTRDFIYIDDVVSVFTCILENISPLTVGQVSKFEIGTGHRSSIRYVVSKLRELMDSETVLNFGAIPYRKNEMLDYNIDTTAIRLLGWVPTVDIDEGLRRVVEASKAMGA